MVQTATPLIAHRGSRLEAPENTLAAYDKALQYDIAGLEIDIHLSKDGEIIVMHDLTVDRTTDGSGWIKDMTLAELKALDAGAGFDASFAEERVPTLSEVCEFIKGQNIILNIELKNNFILYDELEEKMLQTVYDFALADRLTVSSFNHESLYRIGQLDPNIATALLYGYRIHRPWEYAKEVGATALHPDYRLLSEEMVRTVHEHGLQINPYTPNEPDHVQRVAALGVDHIITDNLPAVAVKK